MCLCVDELEMKRCLASAQLICHAKPCRLHDHEVYNPRCHPVLFLLCIFASEGSGNTIIKPWLYFLLLPFGCFLYHLGISICLKRQVRDLHTVCCLALIETLASYNNGSNACYGFLESERRWLRVSESMIDAADAQSH